MEDKEISVLKTDPDNTKQAPAPSTEEPAAVLNSMYSQAAQRVTQPVGEKDYASQISNNIQRENYNYNSPVDKSTEPQVLTTSVAKGNVTTAAFDAEHKMSDTFKATDKEDYSWNKIAKERAQYTYEQEESQVLSEYTKSQQEIQKAASAAMETYFSAKYSGAQTKDKMGWSGGSAISNDIKVAFLEASTAAGMYTQAELQRYGVESQLTVARLYAESNSQALALELYQNEIDKSVREAEITGYYIAPEAGEVMKQQDVANKIIGDPNSTQEEKARARKIISAGNAFFDDLKFEKDSNGNYIGVKTLTQLEFEETKRANLTNEELQRQSNIIAEAQAEVADLSLQLAKDQFTYMKNQQEVLNFREAQDKYGYDGERPKFINTGSGYLQLFPKYDTKNTSEIYYQVKDQSGNITNYNWDGKQYVEKK